MSIHRAQCPYYKLQLGRSEFQPWFQGWPFKRAPISRINRTVLTIKEGVPDTVKWHETVFYWMFKHFQSTSSLSWDCKSWYQVAAPIGSAIWSNQPKIAFLTTFGFCPKSPFRWFCSVNYQLAPLEKFRFPQQYHPQKTWKWQPIYGSCF